MNEDISPSYMFSSKIHSSNLLRLPGSFDGTNAFALGFKLEDAASVSANSLNE